MANRNSEFQNLTFKRENLQLFLCVILFRSFRENIGFCIFNLIIDIVICLSYSIALFLSANGCVSLVQSFRTHHFLFYIFPKMFLTFPHQSRRNLKPCLFPISFLVCWSRSNWQLFLDYKYHKSLICFWTKVWTKANRNSCRLRRQNFFSKNKSVRFMFTFYFISHLGQLPDQNWATDK